MYHRNPFFNLLIWVFTGFGTFGESFKHENNLLRQSHADIINAVAEKEKLKAQIAQLNTDMAVQRQNQKLELERERATWSLSRERESAEQKMQIDAERQKFNFEREQMLARMQSEKDEAIRRAKLEADEILVMKKLDFEQQIKQAELNAQSKILTVKEEYAKKESTLTATLHKEMYGKLNEALVQMTQEGDKNTKFVHELMMKIFDKAPGPNSFEFTQRQYQGQLPQGVKQVEVTT